MITRTTTVGTLKNYRYDLNVSNNNMAKAMNTVITRRTFNSYAESPALATRCFQLRRSFQRTASQLTVNDSVRHKYDVAWSALDGVSQDINTVASDTAFTSILTGLNDADASGRNALGQSMAAKAKSIIQSMNGRYGDNYVFGGAETLNVPFTWEQPKKNPDYIEGYNPNDPATNAVLDPTNEAHAAAFKYKVNPDLVTEDEANPKEFPKGTLYTNDPDKAAFTYEKNPDYNAADPDTGGKYKTDLNLNIDENTVDGDGKHLYDPDTGLYQLTTNDENFAIKKLETNPAYNPDMVSYKYLKTDSNGALVGTNDADESDVTLYYRGVEVDSMDAKDQEKMQYFDREHKYMDVGLGFKEKDGEAVDSSVFDAALQGTYYLGGYGTEDVEVTVGTGGDAYTKTVKVPNNIVSIINRMSAILQNCDGEDGSWASDEEEAEFMALAHKFEDQASIVKQRWDEMDTETSFLRDNSELLTDTADSLSQQFMELEDVDPAAAISSYMFARYCYDAALKVGNSILSQSLMDYMSF